MSRYHQVHIVDVVHVDAPVRITSAEIEDQLAATHERLGMKPGVLEGVAGIVARRFWEIGVEPSDAATRAAELLLSRVGIDRERIGMIVSTSVCRDYLEPSVACLVHGNLRLPASCLNFDVGNACLGFMNGMELAARMIESGALDYALIVDGENSRTVVESSIKRMQGSQVTVDEFKGQFAALTLGSGAAAMLMARAELAPNGHRYLGAVSRAATQHNRLCFGQTDRMFTDTRGLLLAGIQLASATLEDARAEFGWDLSQIQHLVLHQVSKVHTESLAATLSLDLSKAFVIYPEFGNVGPAAIPMVLSNAAQSGRIKRGDRVAFMGIGSGINCAMAEVVW